MANACPELVEWAPGPTPLMNESRPSTPDVPSLKISEMPQGERPREKLLARGANALVDPELIASAYAVIVVHNHPSGDPSPSQSDHSLTRRLGEAAELLQIKLLDHVIIGAPAEGCPPYFSFKEAGVL